MVHVFSSRSIETNNCISRVGSGNIQTIYCENKPTGIIDSGDRKHLLGMVREGAFGAWRQGGAREVHRGREPLNIPPE